MGGINLRRDAPGFGVGFLGRPSAQGILRCALAQLMPFADGQCIRWRRECPDRFDVHPQGTAGDGYGGMRPVACDADMPAFGRSDPQGACRKPLYRNAVRMRSAGQRNQHLGQLSPQAAHAGLWAARQVCQITGAQGRLPRHGLHDWIVEPHHPGERCVANGEPARQGSGVPDRGVHYPCANRAGEPSQEVPAGRLSPFITTDRSPSCASAPISASYSTMA